MQWLNEPAQWRVDGKDLSFVTGDKTDFWQRTFNGWRNDNGHYYHESVTGDFSAEVVFAAGYKAQYDQAGLMLRISADQWIKAGVEFAHGHAALSSVHTQGAFSDWAIAREVDVGESVRLRLTRKGDAVCVQYKAEKGFRTLRLCTMPGASTALIGPMACSPIEGGMNVRFSGYSRGPAVDFTSEV
ncbi:DUF1349 domain-containing protein [Aestuariivirga sp. YIM B02566]|uniref:DUF1349 domain-containing protein n=1 Tax=Taklimakanibacter albus TaxID=2800327 RepID=A0ACC5R5T6_9HYPH|nr:DUF1349 domain-containing protein [Aestuariivirga sp. YIM B02566]MBK1868017.1 DUF1349 domain-containing protein [Aestuariivirga sp. YIM B02566]